MRRALVIAGLLLGIGSALAEELSVHAQAQDGAAMRGVTVVVVSSAGVERQATTDDKGEATIAGLAPGPYTLVAVYGSEKGEAQVVLEPEAVLHRTFVFPSTVGETIQIRQPGSKRGKPARVTKTIQTLPYSDELIDRNEYAIVWLLIDIDPRGTVTNARILKAPKKDRELESIALGHVRTMRFEPARDPAGVAIMSSMVLVMQWAPYWAQRTGKFVWAPCAGDGALPIDMQHSHEVGFRDCNPPKGFEKLDFLQRSGKRLYTLTFPEEAPSQLRQLRGKSLEDVRAIIDDYVR